MVMVTRTSVLQDPYPQLAHNERARRVRLEDVASLVPACSGARVCHEQGREDSTGFADRSIKIAELVEKYPLTTRHKVTQRRLHESGVRSHRRVTNNSREENGLANQDTSTADQGQGVRTQWPGSPWKQGLTT